MKMLFVVGTGRCGSTLIHEILARHEGAGFVSNLEDRLPWLSGLGRWNNQLFAATSGAFTRKGRLRFGPSEAYRLIGREVSPIYENSCRDLTAADASPWLTSRFRLFFEGRAEAQKRSVFLHKYTGWPRIGFFAEIFPDAKFVHVVRDGRAVANSWLQMPWWGGYRGPENWLWGELPTAYEEEWRDSGRSFCRLAAIGWKILMDAFGEVETTIPPERYMRLRYEDVLEAPEVFLRRVLEFGGLPWSTQFNLALEGQRFERGRVQAFQQDLSGAQLNELEESLHLHLSMYGYD